MAIMFFCTECEAELLGPDDFAGTVVECGVCGPAEELRPGSRPPLLAPRRSRRGKPGSFRYVFQTGINFAAIPLTR